jgi:hypothetical protein
MGLLMMVVMVSLFFTTINRFWRTNSDLNSDFNTSLFEQLLFDKDQDYQIKMMSSDNNLTAFQFAFFTLNSTDGILKIEIESGGKSILADVPAARIAANSFVQIGVKDLNIQHQTPVSLKFKVTGPDSTAIGFFAPKAGKYTRQTLMTNAFLVFQPVYGLISYSPITLDLIAHQIGFGRQTRQVVGSGICVAIILISLGSLTSLIIYEFVAINKTAEAMKCVVGLGLLVTMTVLML